MIVTSTDLHNPRDFHAWVKWSLKRASGKTKRNSGRKRLRDEQRKGRRRIWRRVWEEKTNRKKREFSVRFGNERRRILASKKSLIRCSRQRNPSFSQKNRRRRRRKKKKMDRSRGVEERGKESRIEAWRRGEGIGLGSELKIVPVCEHGRIVEEVGGKKKKGKNKAAF